MWHIISFRKIISFKIGIKIYTKLFEKTKLTIICDEMREREGKEGREILSEDGREIGWMKEVWKRGERIAKERGGE
jgi:hypothetical protein